MNWQGDHSQHAVVIPLFGQGAVNELRPYLQELVNAGFLVVVVDNNPRQLALDAPEIPGCRLLLNDNVGGIAGGLNRGVDFALEAGAQWITLLDQDSRIDVGKIACLREPFEQQIPPRKVIGPCIWDEQHQRRHGRWTPSSNHLDSTRLLITSGTTFQAADWPELGRFHEGLFIDFVDHVWCFRAQVRGFVLFQHPGVILKQTFGAVHPNPFCRLVGMRLYTPQRHFYGLRNLRWLCLRPYVPLDLKVKAVVKMFAKPLLWLAFEPQRRANLRAICRGLTAPLPDPY